MINRSKKDRSQSIPLAPAVICSVIMVMRAIISVNSRKGATKIKSLIFMEFIFHHVISRMTAGRVQVAALLDMASKNEMIEII